MLYLSEIVVQTVENKVQFFLVFWLNLTASHLFPVEIRQNI